ncbi:MAG TPA: hypothetical protein VGB64_13445 [Actinomycetota bacterium]
MRRPGLRVALAGAALAATIVVPHAARAANCGGTSTGRVPIPDLGASTYSGAQGGLYPEGANEPPFVHATVGASVGALVAPRNAAGLPDPAGKIVLLTIGMSNTRQESAKLVLLSKNDPLRDPGVVVVNGAQGGRPAEDIDDLTAPYWTYVDQQLAGAGVTPQQVQAVWLKQANRSPTEMFPADAERLQANLRTIVTILKARYPNLWLTYLSSRIYAGYASTQLNPEPFAYQSGFAVKWLIEEQIGGTLPVGAAPWLAWGPYLWADGLTPRAGDGLTWACDDFQTDGTHPSDQGAAKVGQMLLDFLHTDPSASSWYTR